jgi:hypothetical protein
MSAVETFFDQLKTSDNKMKVLVNFYIYLFGENKKINIYSTMAKLIKVYGYDVIFWSLLDCYDSSNLNMDNPYGILAYMAKERLMKKDNVLKSIDLTEFAKEQERISTTKIVNFPDPFGVSNAS